jgi:hypothetical protein
MKHRPLCLAVGLLMLASFALAAYGPEQAGAGARNAKIDVEPAPLKRIKVGTVIEKQAPKGWTNLVLFAVPTLTPEDERDAPKTATYYAQMFKFTVLANVARLSENGRDSYYLHTVARGFATPVKGKETVISSSNTLGASLGLFGRTILEENENILDKEVRQVARTPTMLIFDARAIMLRNKTHVGMIMRHALVVDPASAHLYTLVWLLTPEYQTAEEAIQLLPDPMFEKRMLSVDRNKFTLGIPDKDAFALRQVPPGTPIPYTPALRQVATIKTFDAQNVPEIEATLLATAMKARN